MKILHIITGLGDGGAEGVLSRLCLYDKESNHIVISFMDEGKYGVILRKNNIEVICLGLQQGSFSIQAFYRLIKLLKEIKPDVIQTWMYHADLIGGVAARIAGINNVFWGIRHSTLEPGKSKQSTIFIAKLCAYLSFLIPKKVVCCAHDALQVHKELGYKNSKLIVIQNGFDLGKFKPNQQAGLNIRREFKVSPEQFLIGTVGRYDPQKDHLNLLKSLSILLSEGLNFKCILVGKGLTAENETLSNDILEHNLEKSIILAGTRSDVPAIMNALDLHVLPSAYGEGFPNVVAEAMACGTPCIATDVGDAREIVLSEDFLVKPKSFIELADKIRSYYVSSYIDDEVVKALAQAAINKVSSNYSLDGMVCNYFKAWNG